MHDCRLLDLSTSKLSRHDHSLAGSSNSEERGSVSSSTSGLRPAFILPKIIHNVHKEFEITDKICFTVTDSGYNCLRAFKHFSVEEEPDEDADAGDGDVLES